jgi:hypothetical protein
MENRNFIILSVLIAFSFAALGYDGSEDCPIVEKYDVNTYLDGSGWTSLHYASTGWCGADMVKRLLDRGSDVNMKTKDNNLTSLDMVASRGDLEKAKILLLHDAVVTRDTIRNAKKRLAWETKKRRWGLPESAITETRRLIRLLRRNLKTK